MENIYKCKKCNYVTDRASNYKRHINSKRHLGNKKSEIIKSSCEKVYLCQFCNKKYKTLWGQKKHLEKCKQKNAEKERIINDYVEDKFKSEVSKKTIEIKENIVSKSDGVNNINYTNENIKVSKKDTSDDMTQQDINKKMLETITNISNDIKNLKTSNIINNNCNQTNISINLFLNEYCSNAMNLTDFVDRIKYTFEDVMKVYNNGYTQGLSNVVIKELKDMPILERPIHCTDKKRGVLYIKDNDQWKKDSVVIENDTNELLKKMRTKQYLALGEWELRNPDWFKSQEGIKTRQELVMRLLGSDDDNELLKHHKEVLKNIANHVPIKEAMNKIQNK